MATVQVQNTETSLRDLHNGTTLFLPEILTNGELCAPAADLSDIALTARLSFWDNKVTLVQHSYGGEPRRGHYVLRVDGEAFPVEFKLHSFSFSRFSHLSVSEAQIERGTNLSIYALDPFKQERLVSVYHAYFSEEAAVAAREFAELRGPPLQAEKVAA